MKYLRSATFGSKDIMIRKSEFVAKTQFLYATLPARHCDVVAPQVLILRTNMTNAKSGYMLEIQNIMFFSIVLHDKNILDFNLRFIYFNLT